MVWSLTLPYPTANTRIPPLMSTEAKPKELRTFQVLPHRWKVERTLGWLNRSRRLSKDYERDTGSSEAMVHLAMIHLMLKRLCPI